MLLNLHVKNFAIIDEADIDFSDNLNIFTGETGAGKSLLLGALNMALGARTPKDIVREDAEFALSELTFGNIPENIRELLEEQGISAEDELVISRKMMQNGRNIVRVNGETVNSAFVKEIGTLLVNIYGQNEHQSLNSSAKQMKIIDDFGGAENEKLKENVRSAYAEYRKLKEESESSLDDAHARKRRQELLEYEINEIESAALEEGEEDELRSRHKVLANSMIIAENLGNAGDMLNGDGQAADCVSAAIKAVGRIADLDERLGGIYDSLNDIESIVSDCVRDIESYMDDLPDDREELQEIEERLDVISSLKNKYGATVSEINDYLEKSRQELEKLNDYENYREKLEAGLETATGILKESSKRLSECRKTCAEKLGKMITEALLELNFNQVVFQIDVTDSGEFHAEGTDNCEFMISLNPGEKPKPLAEVASGGELSRIMLGIKSVMADRDGIGTLLFDEIDAGISGRTAQKVSEKLCRIATDRQVICITHLPQIASMADNHYEIHKDVSEGRTHTYIRQLSDEEIKDELARLIGGAEITDNVITSALEIKALADNRKKEIRNR